LLASVPIGRVVVTQQALPAVSPVHFAVVDDGIVFRASAGGAVATGASDAIVAFEADQVDAGSGSGWSVVVVGQAREIPDGAGRSRGGGLGLRSWAPQQPSCLIRLSLDRISGRRTPSASSGEEHTPVPSRT
jgi:hypothetical protein